MNLPHLSSKFIFGPHAETRILKSTGLSSGHLLGMLNSAAFVWLPRISNRAECFALVYSGVAETFFVATVMDEAPVIKSLLSLTQWEAAHSGPLPDSWRTLAQAATVRALLPLEVERASPESMKSPVTQPVGTVKISVLLRQDPLQCPPGEIAEVLGTINAEGLRELGATRPGQCKPAHVVTNLPVLLGSGSFQAWLLARLGPFTSRLNEHSQLLVRVTRGKKRQYVDITQAAVRALSGANDSGEPEGQAALQAEGTPAF